MKWRCETGGTIFGRGQEKREEVETRTKRTMIYATEKALKEHGDKVSQDERLKIEQTLSDAKEAVKVRTRTYPQSERDTASGLAQTG